MRRRFALRSEVLGGLHEAGAEDLLPEAIHGHAGRQGIRFVDKPLRQARAGFLGMTPALAEARRERRVPPSPAADRTCRDRGYSRTVRGLFVRSGRESPPRDVRLSRVRPAAFVLRPASSDSRRTRDSGNKVGAHPSRRLDNIALGFERATFMQRPRRGDLRFLLRSARA